MTSMAVWRVTLVWRPIHRCCGTRRRIKLFPWDAETEFRLFLFTGS